MRLGFIVAFTLSLSGCVIPYSGVYYLPSASEGKVVGYGDWQAPTTLYIRRNENIAISVTGYFAILKPPNKQGVEIRISVPQKKFLKIDIRKIEILNQDSQVIADLNSYEAVNLLNGTRIPVEVAHETLDGSLVSSKYGTTYILEYDFVDVPPPDKFYVLLPLMKIDDTSYSPLKIEYTKTHGWWWQPIM